MNMKPSTAKYWLNFYTHAKETIFEEWIGNDGVLAAILFAQGVTVVLGGLIIGAVAGTEKLTDAQGWEFYGAVNALLLACFLGYWIFKPVYAFFAGFGFATEQKLKEAAAKPEPLPNYTGSQGGELSLDDRFKRRLLQENALLEAQGKEPKYILDP
jgi:hypothetical protein